MSFKQQYLHYPKSPSELETLRRRIECLKQIPQAAALLKELEAEFAASQPRLVDYDGGRAAWPS